MRSSRVTRFACALRFSEMGQRRDSGAKQERRQKVSTLRTISTGYQSLSARSLCRHSHLPLIIYSSRACKIASRARAALGQARLVTSWMILLCAYA